jgi:hypothetical protein
MPLDSLDNNSYTHILLVVVITTNTSCTFIFLLLTKKLKEAYTYIKTKIIDEHICRPSLFFSATIY